MGGGSLWCGVVERNHDHTPDQSFLSLWKSLGFTSLFMTEFFLSKVADSIAAITSVMILSPMVGSLASYICGCDFFSPSDAFLRCTSLLDTSSVVRSSWAGTRRVSWVSPEAVYICGKCFSCSSHVFASWCCPVKFEKPRFWFLFCCLLMLASCLVHLLFFFANMDIWNIILGWLSLMVNKQGFLITVCTFGSYGASFGFP